jgi:DNA mismatch repair protein MSH5
VSVASTRTFVGDDRSVAGTEQQQPQDDVEFDEDTLSEVIMAVNMLPNGTVGCAYYVARVEKLYFMEDVRMGGPDAVDACEFFSSTR